MSQSLRERQVIQHAIKAEYTAWRKKLRREPTVKERKQIVAIGMAKARKVVPGIPKKNPTEAYTGREFSAGKPLWDGLTEREAHALLAILRENSVEGTVEMVPTGVVGQFTWSVYVTQAVDSYVRMVLEGVVDRFAQMLIKYRMMGGKGDVPGIQYGGGKPYTGSSRPRKLRPGKGAGWNPKKNPHIVVDSATNEIVSVVRGHPISTFNKAFGVARREAAKRGRLMDVIAHPYVPRGFAKGAKISPLFRMMGGYVQVDAQGGVHNVNPKKNPLTTDEFEEIHHHASGNLRAGYTWPEGSAPRTMLFAAAAEAKRVANKYYGGYGQNPSLVPAIAAGVAGAVASKVLSNPLTSKEQGDLKAEAGPLYRRGHDLAARGWGRAGQHFHGQADARHDIAYRYADTTRQADEHRENPMGEGRFIVTRDGKEVAKVSSENEGFKFIHDAQDQSVDWAMAHEGWDVVKIEGGKVVYSMKAASREFQAKLRREADDIRRRGRHQSNPHLEGEECEMCGGPLGFLGQLGNLEHYQCRNCGAETSVPSPVTKKIKCRCGRVLELEGDTECSCGQWYNAFGQRLKDPSQWEEEGNPLTADETRRLGASREWNKGQADTSKGSALHYGAAYFRGREHQATEDIERFGYRGNPDHPLTPRINELFRQLDAMKAQGLGGTPEYMKLLHEAMMLTQQRSGRMISGRVGGSTSSLRPGERFRAVPWPSGKVGGTMNQILAKIQNAVETGQQGDVVDIWVEELFQWARAHGSSGIPWDAFPLAKSYYDSRVAMARRGGYASNPLLMTVVNPGNGNPIQKLLTKEVLAKLPPLYSQESVADPLAQVKFFTPWSNWTWYATEFDGQDTFFGLVQGHETELGYFSLSELSGLRGPGGLRIERDIHFRPTPLSRIRGGAVSNPKPRCDPRTCANPGHQPKVRVWKGFKGEWYWRLVDPHGKSVPMTGKARSERGAKRIANQHLRKCAKRNPLTAKEAAYHLRDAKASLKYAKSEPRSRGGAFDAGRAYGQAKVVMTSGPKRAVRPADRIRSKAMSVMQRTGWSNNSAKKNPGGRRRKVTMSLEKFARWVKRQNDPALWRDFMKKVNGYKNWTHGTMPKTVTVEQIEKPGVKGVWMTYNAGRQPESTYVMPGHSKRKGAWKHKWGSMPEIKNDPEAGMVLTKLKGQSKISDFYHR